MTTTEKLARLKHYGTRWEVIAEHPDGRRLLLVYASAKSGRGMLRAIRDVAGRNPEALVRLFGDDPQFRFARRVSQGGTVGEWRIRWGRTQRDAISNGELPFFAD